MLLDEVNSLPLPVQAKLLRAVDERVFEPVGSEKSREMRARLIAATNAPLPQEVQAGRFRADLYYRLNVVGFFLPPLRERPQAIAVLADRLLGEFAGRSRPDVTGISAEAMRQMEKYGWPGNVRELRNVIERAVTLCQGPLVEPADLPEALQAGVSVPPARKSFAIFKGPPASASQESLSLAGSKQQAEVRRICQALDSHNGNRVHAAAELGISRIALYKKLHKYGLMKARPSA